MALSVNANFSEEKDSWEIKVSGEVDISNAQEFKSKLDGALELRRSDLLIDLSSLNYIDSTGLGVIIGTFGTVKKEGLTVKLINPRENVRKLLNISGLDKVLC
ncbi:MAG: STAS domain-containing protein [Clostridiales Family XIII bacterium]|nr:STAS domain-containing protein [Clostridiales Family XIII bacterium]